MQNIADTTATLPPSFFCFLSLISAFGLLVVYSILLVHISIYQYHSEKVSSNGQMDCPVILCGLFSTNKQN